jgi:hypothetical protein
MASTSPAPPKPARGRLRPPERSPGQGSRTQVVLLAVLVVGSGLGLVAVGLDVIAVTL